ncbi:MAG: hypothetical protein HY770_01090 [Chitinivibrionia bacterium]|nr:hypothetical protein [Chitinivibrionia bacterium]
MTAFTGFAGPVAGKMFCQAGKTVARFVTALGPSDPYNQISLNGSRTGNSISGSFYIDNGAAVDGTFTLVKQ